LSEQERVSREQAAAAARAGGGTSSQDPGTDLTDPTGGNQSPSAAARAPEGGGGQQGSQVTTDPNDPTGGNQSPTLEAGLGTRVGGDVGAALNDANTPSVDVTNAANTLGQGGISSARDVLAGDTPVSQALDAAAPSTFNQEQQPGMFDAPTFSFGQGAPAPAKDLIDPGSFQDPTFAPYGNPDQQAPAIQAPLDPDPSLSPLEWPSYKTPDNIIRSPQDPSVDPSIEQPSPAFQPPASQGQASIGNLIQNMLGIGTANAANAFGPGENLMPLGPSNPNLTMTGQGPTTETIVSPWDVGATPIAPYPNVENNPFNVNPKQPGVQDASDPFGNITAVAQLSEPDPAAARAQFNEPAVAGLPTAGSTAAQVNRALKGDSLETAQARINQAAEQGEFDNTLPLASPQVADNVPTPTPRPDSAPQIPGTQGPSPFDTAQFPVGPGGAPSTQQAPPSPDTTPPAPGVVDAGPTKTVTEAPSEGPGDTTTPEVTRALNSADGGGGTSTSPAANAAISPQQLIQPIPGAPGGGTQGTPAAPAAPSPFVPPGPPPLEDIGFGNINPNAGLFGIPGLPGGATGVPGGIPGPVPPPPNPNLVFDALNNAVDTGA
jgi:hypothetical protein